METLLAFDRTIFLAINHLPHTFIRDGIALFLSGVGSAGFIWLCIGLLLFLREEKKDHRFFVPLIAVVFGCFIVVEGLLKYLFARPRPGADIGAIVVGGASWFSFPSSHAAISWAMAVVLSRYEPRWSILFYILAATISFSRIYLGVHYPVDVLVGSFIGYGVGMWALRFTR